MSKDLDDYKVISVSTTMAEIKRQQKEHKALEIIIKKEVHITLIKHCKNVDQYNHGLLATMNKTTAKKYNLSDEQFNAVKEVLL